MRDDLAPFRLTLGETRILRGQLLERQDEFTFEEEPQLASLIASLGIQREVLTISNELAPYVFDATLGEPVDPKRMRSELVRYRNAIGVRVWTEGVADLDIRLRGLKSLVNPEFSYDSAGRMSSMVIFPESIARILALEGAEPVIVPQWGLNTIFGGFDGSTHYYQTNLWELDNNDTLRFAGLLRRKRIPLLGTHDLTAHLSGVKSERVDRLSRLGKEVEVTIQRYFAGISAQSRTRASLVVPYLIGVLLDDLAQPANYGSIRHEAMIEELLLALDATKLSPSESRRIVRFPAEFQSIIAFTRDSAGVAVLGQARERVSRLVAEIHQGSIRTSD